LCRCGAAQKFIRPTSSAFFINIRIARAVSHIKKLPEHERAAAYRQARQIGYGERSDDGLSADTAKCENLLTQQEQEASADLLNRIPPGETEWPLEGDSRW
jgi:hypothetical protein